MTTVQHKQIYVAPGQNGSDSTGMGSGGRLPHQHAGHRGGDWNTPQRCVLLPSSIQKGRSEGYCRVKSSHHSI